MEPTETTQIVKGFATFFSLSILPVYLLGFATFFIILIIDWLNPKRTLQKWSYYVQDFLYTIISIAVGISIGIAIEVSEGWSLTIAIGMGLFGAQIIKKLWAMRDKITDKIVKQVEDKVEEKTGEGGNKAGS